MPKPPIAWSYSRLNTFEQCPRRFYGVHISKKFPKPTEEPEHFIRGRAVHTELELAIKEQKMVAGERAYLMPIIDAIRRSSFYIAEMQVAFTAQLKQTSWFAKDVWCRIIFDVFASPDKSRAVIIDWKTGKVADKARDQLALFAAGAFARFPKLQHVTTAYIWCDHPNAPPTWEEYDRSDMNKLWQEFGDRAELIQLANESGNWEPKPSAWNCSYCPASPTECEFKSRYAK